MRLLHGDCRLNQIEFAQCAARLGSHFAQNSSDAAGLLVDPAGTTINRDGGGLLTYLAVKRPVFRSVADA